MMSTWVSVTDRLPENVASGWNGKFRATGEYDCDDDIRGVTHWMEIPDVPTETADP